MEVTRIQRIDDLIMALRYVDVESVAANGIDGVLDKLLAAGTPQEEDELIVVLERHLMAALGPVLRVGAAFHRLQVWN